MTKGLPENPQQILSHECEAGTGQRNLISGWCELSTHPKKRRERSLRSRLEKTQSRVPMSLFLSLSLSRQGHLSGVLYMVVMVEGAATGKGPSRVGGGC